MTNETDPIQSPISEARRLANIRNAQLSTGPRTAEGKAISRGNALKHGLCAETIAVPGENGELFETRFEAWSEGLNPLALAAGDYIVAQLVRKSIRLDRCHVVHDSTVAALVRDAVRDRRKDRAGQVEALARLFPDDADIAVRKLRDMSEGCEYLIKEWEQFDAALVEPSHWDNDDQKNSVLLMGRYRSIHHRMPCRVVAMTIAMVEHRVAAKRVKDRDDARWYPGTSNYIMNTEYEYDRKRLPELTEKAVAARAEVVAMVAEAIAELRLRKVELEASEAVEVAEAALKVGFVDTDRATLMHRHESDLERGFYRGMKELRELTRFAMQVEAVKKLAPSKPWLRTPPSPPMPARNEPKDRLAKGALRDWDVVEPRGYSEVDASIVPGIEPKRKQ